MDFEFNDDQELLRASTRSFIQTRSPLASLRSNIESPEVFDRSVWEDGAAFGWTAMLIPQELGGGSVSAQPIVDLVVLAEEFGRTLQPGPLLPANVVANAIVCFGSDQQKREYLPGIAGGQTVPAWCMSDDGGPEVGGVKASPGPDGAGSLVLSGRAGFVHGATVADLFLVSAIGESGPVHLLVRASTAGVTVRRQVTLDLTRRFGEVSFESVEVPASAVVASGEAAAALTTAALALATVLQAAEAVGGAEHLFATTLQYTIDRVQFGRSIGSFQAIKHRLADLAVSLEAMRAATHYAALAIAEGFADAPEAVATAGAYVTEAYAFLCGECLQISGGIGFTWEHDLHLFLRRARTDEVLYGDASWHREQLCRLVENPDPVPALASSGVRL